MIELTSLLPCLVYNWTVDEIIDWLCNVVHLPQYSENFRQNEVKGKDMPRYIVCDMYASPL